MPGTNRLSKGVRMSTQPMDFNIRFNAESAQFSKDVDHAKKMLRGYTGEANQAVAANDSLCGTMGNGAKKAFEFGEGVLRVAGAVSAVAGAVTGATAVLIRQQAEQARQLEKMSTVAGVTVEQMQALSYASNQYGISGEKMSDILKDVQDKLGDFAATGGGEFKDFFENIAPLVGLTIDQLQRMSGQEALIAVKSALDAANIPMQQQVFYLEAIANDASALMPLLDKNGQKLLELTNRYEDLNVAMSEFDIQQFKQMDQELEETALKLERSFSVAVLGAREQISWLSDHIAKSVTWWGELFDSWSDDPRTANGLIKKLGDLRSEAKYLENDLTRAKEVLADLENTKASAQGNAGQEAYLKFKGWDKRISEAKDKVKELSGQLSSLNNQIGDHQTQYEKQVFGMHSQPITPNVTENIPSLNRPGNDSDKLTALDIQYASELEKLKLSHQERLMEIENLQSSELELKQRGYESLDALKIAYKDKENQFYAEQEEAYFQKLDAQMQRELDAFSRKEDEKTRKAEQASAQRASTEQRLEQQVLGMKFAVANQALGLIASTAEEGSSLQKAALVAQKAMAAAQVFMQGEVAATAAMAPPPIGLGFVGGSAAAASIRTMSAVSAGLIMAQTVAGMAHSGISEIPEEGTWLLNKGERVYTNESALKLDYMYNKITSPQFGLSNDPSIQLSKQQSLANNQSVNWTVNIENHQGEAKVTTGIDDKQKVLSIMLEDVHSSGTHYSALSKKLGIKSGGYK